MNPIEAVLNKLVGMIPPIPMEARAGAFWMAVALAVMLYAVSRKNLLGGHDRAQMKIWTHMSATMNDRIGELTPHFASSMSLLAQRYGETLQEGKDMVGFIKSIDGSVKEKAEMDYCMRDANKDEMVAALTEKLGVLLNKESKSV